MKKLILKTALLACATFVGNASAVVVRNPAQGTWEATLLGRDTNGNAVTQRDTNGVLDASAVFLYDTVLNITWLRDASKYALTWDQAKTWASDFNLGSYDDWRLPTMVDTGASGCDYAYAGTDCGYNVQTKSGSTVFNEMAHLYYDTLGNKGILDSLGVEQPGWDTTNTGDFQNFVPGRHWSGPEYAPSPGNAWSIYTYGGGQTYDAKGNDGFVMAVRDGDVLVSAVPEPETYALMLAGLGLVGAAAKRRQAVNTGSKKAAP